MERANQGFTVLPRILLWDQSRIYIKIGDCVITCGVFKNKVDFRSEKYLKSGKLRDDNDRSGQVSVRHMQQWSVWWVGNKEKTRTATIRVMWRKTVVPI
ncbi:unnamed protein product [Wuchereria bancrofti]|uniref:Uncharacterized protein n=1 Tax=Wuchereria bancrofti TaxID=6293 RepID=A0A3P7DTU6_WUCBA|nr:unnamed protein product [Wuchereria bancrofti]